MCNLNRIIFSGKIVSEPKYSTLTSKNGNKYDVCSFNLLLETIGKNGDVKNVTIGCNCNSETTQTIREIWGSTPRTDYYLVGSGTFAIGDDNAINGINVDMATVSTRPFKGSKAILVGKLARDPESKNGNYGTITDFTPVVDSGYGDNQKAAFPIVTAWKQTAEFVRNYLKKGQMVAADCRIECDDYRTKKDGKYRFKFTAMSVKALTFNKNEGTTETSPQKHQSKTQKSKVEQEPVALDLSMFGINQSNMDQLGGNVQQQNNGTFVQPTQNVGTQQPINLQPNNGMMQQQYCGNFVQSTQNVGMQQPINLQQQMNGYQQNAFVNPAQQVQPVQNFQQQNAVQMANNQQQINQMQYGNVNPQLNLVQDSDLNF